MRRGLREAETLVYIREGPAPGRIEREPVTACRRVRHVPVFSGGWRGDQETIAAFTRGALQRGIRVFALRLFSGVPDCRRRGPRI